MNIQRRLMSEFAVLVVTFVCVVLNSAYAQTPCKPDCPLNNYSSYYEKDVKLPNGCWVRITYALRYSCTGYYDVAISKIAPRTQECNGMKVAEMFKLGSVALLEANPMNFPPASWQLDTCANNYRIITGGCWKYTINACGDSVASMCDSVPCCVTQYMVCTDSLGNRSAGRLSDPSGGTCNTSQADSCKSICNLDSAITNMPNKGMHKPAVGYIGADILAINPNPSDVGTAIEFLVAEQTKVLLTVHGADGQEVARLVDADHAPGRYTAVFSSQDLPSGRYFYRLNTPRGVSTGSITVTH